MDRKALSLVPTLTKYGLRLDGTRTKSRPWDVTLLPWSGTDMYKQASQS